MVPSATEEQAEQVIVRVMVDKEKSKVLFAEAGKSFVDVLFTFLALPLGTIARMVSEKSNIEAVRFGSLSSLYESVSDLDEQYLGSHSCKERLLVPENSMEPYLQQIKVGFVKENMTFLISDNLFITPNVLGTSINLLRKLGINDVNAIDKQTVIFSKKEVIDLLKLSLISKTPLSDFIFKKDRVVGNFDPRNLIEFWIGLGEVEKPSNEMVINVLKRKSNAKVLFVEVKDDFADLLFRFLTFPLGGVLHMLRGLSFLSCMDNLYKSVTELIPDRCLRSQIFKDLVQRKLCIGPTQFTSTREEITFMVTDDLVVTPMSSISGLAYLQKLNVPLNDVEERVISIGLKEGLSILKASLTSTSAFTNGLGLSIMHQFLRENFP